ncbi:MAG: hypothetical protein ABFS03_00805 [Chloroflexota bacterium]
MTTHKAVYIQLTHNGKKLCLTPSQHSEITRKSAVKIGMDYKDRKKLGITNRQACGYDMMPPTRKPKKADKSFEMMSAFLKTRLI